MGRGRRYEEQKLNMKKVIAVIIAIVVVIMIVFMIQGILNKEKDSSMISSTSYFAAYKDEKWGVINSNGETVIEPSYKEMIIIPNSKNDVFLCTYDVNYETGEYKTKVLNSKNQEIFTEYEKIEAIQNIDANNNIWYESNVLKFKKDGKYGTITLKGDSLLNNEYDSISSMSGVENALLISKDGKIGVSDDNGKVIIPTIYSEITNLGKDNKSGYIVKNAEGKYGIVDYSNNQVLEAKYEGVKNIYNNDLYVVKVAGKDVLIRKDGTELLKDKFSEIVAILKTKDAGIIYTKDGKYGVMNITGDVIIENTYDYIKEAKAGIFIASKAEKFGIIDSTKQEKLPFEYTTITYNELADIYITEDAEFNSKILNNNFEVKQTGIFIKIDDTKGYFEIKQGEEYKYYNFKFEEKNVKDVLSKNTLFLSKKDGKYGYLDKNGNVVVEYKYDDAKEQNEYGFVAVKKDGKWGALNNKGNVVIEPIYKLDDYLVVDFIGKWHAGKDLNMNYYNQLEK